MLHQHILARIGAIFEGVHGAAPDSAGHNKANPSAMILPAIMMCRYINLDDIADKIEHALAVTFSLKRMTGDVNKRECLINHQSLQIVSFQILGKTCDGFTPSSFKPVPKCQYFHLNQSMKGAA